MLKLHYHRRRRCRLPPPPQARRGGGGRPPASQFLTSSCLPTIALSKKSLPAAVLLYTAKAMLTMGSTSPSPCSTALSIIHPSATAQARARGLGRSGCLLASGSRGNAVWCRQSIIPLPLCCAAGCSVCVVWVQRGFRADASKNAAGRREENGEVES